MQSYAETVGRGFFDWNAFLDRSIREEPCGIDYKVAKHLAESWVTCACGNQCSAIPRYDTGEPLDNTLWSLGRRFLDEIDARGWASAKETLKAIEERSAEILAHIEVAAQLKPKAGE